VTIPDFQSLMLPVLEATNDGGDHKGSALISMMSARFELSENEKAELLPSGRQRAIENRVHWAITYLAKCGLLERPRRGFARITSRGREVLKERPSRIDLRFLARFPELEQFRSRSRDAAPGETLPQGEPVPLIATPDERLRQAHLEIEAALRSDLLTRVIDQPPVFLENLVIDLLVAMGYGGVHGRGARLGKSGDGGVDGVIDQDALGLDRVYVQAKRYSDKPVTAGDIRSFFGSLDAVKAAKGVFITTSSFTRDAQEQAEKFTKRIVLIDGELLAGLMLKHGVGVRVEERIEVKKLDEDYFSEDE
jgi:restriction system protein